MNIFDEIPGIPECPHCGHEGEGLQFAIPDSAMTAHGFSLVQASCLACGAHGPTRPSYAEAVKSFRAGEVEVVG